MTGKPAALSRVSKAADMFSAPSGQKGGLKEGGAAIEKEMWAERRGRGGEARQHKKDAPRREGWVSEFANARGSDLGF